MDDAKPKSGDPQRAGKIISDDDETLFLMGEISRSARRIYDERVADLGLNQTQWRIIGLLMREPDLTQAAIAKRLELESATIGQAVHALSERGIVQRERASSDRRIWRIRFTGNIDTILPDLRRSADRLHTTLWQGFTPEEKDVLKKLLERVSRNLEQSAAGAE